MDHTYRWPTKDCRRMTATDKNLLLPSLFSHITNTINVKVSSIFFVLFLLDGYRFCQDHILGTTILWIPTRVSIRYLIIIEVLIHANYNQSLWQDSNRWRWLSHVVQYWWGYNSHHAAHLKAKHAWVEVMLDNLQLNKEQKNYSLKSSSEMFYHGIFTNLKPLWYFILFFFLAQLFGKASNTRLQGYNFSSWTKVSPATTHSQGKKVHW